MLVFIFMAQMIYFIVPIIFSQNGTVYDGKEVTNNCMLVDLVLGVGNKTITLDDNKCIEFSFKIIINIVMIVYCY